MSSWILIGIGGALGSITRAYVSLLLNSCFENFPLGTLVSNALACFILGTIVGFGSYKNIQNSQILPLFSTGFCGGFSTFSTYILECYKITEKNQFSQVLFYGLGSILISYIFLFIGWSLSKMLIN